MNLRYSIELNEDLQWKMHKPHFHSDYEVLFALAGSGNFFVDRVSLPIRPGMLLILTNEVLHRSNVDESLYSRYVLHFDNSLLAEVSTTKTDLASEFFSYANQGLYLEDEDFAAMRHTFSACYNNDSTVFAADLEQDMTFIRLLLDIVIAYKSHSYIPSHGGYPDAQPDELVAEIISYISQNLEHDLCLDGLSARFFINKFYLCRRFKQATGFSVMEYIINRRILKARALLGQGYSVQQAGEESGFHDSAHFIRMFSKIVGLPPGKYAKLNKR